MADLIPATLAELAAQKGDSLDIIHARVTILETLRAAAIRATSPEDWVLFKSPDGQEIAYLQDCGAQRVRDVFGIEIFDVTTPEKITGESPAEFMYLQRGSGRCRLTHQTVVMVEGGRSSTEDFVRGKSGPDLEYEVRKATRANLDGSITRQLSGLSSVPVLALSAAWLNTSKTIASCRLGRGYGTRDERLGATIPPPVCTACGTVGVLRAAKGNRGAFYGCPNYQTHPDQRWTVDAQTWLRDYQAKLATEGGANAG